MMASNEWWCHNSPLLCQFSPFLSVFLQFTFLSVGIVEGFAFQIREYSSSDWTKI